MKSSKSNAKNVTGAPEGYHTVTPFIVVKDAAQLLDFMSSAFGAVALNRMADGDGTISHAETKVGDSVVMMFDAKKDWPDTPSFLRLYVSDCDAVYVQGADLFSLTRH